MLGWLKKKEKEKIDLRQLLRFPVAIGVKLEEAADSDPLWKTVSQSDVRPRDVRQDWSLLGYDVADRDQTSALSGCGYTPKEMAQARLLWAGRVNKWGLLVDFEAAVAFKKFSDTRVPEHQPFHVYELFRIDHVGAPEPAAVR
jgi:hypothetical protein